MTQSRPLVSQPASDPSRPSDEYRDRLLALASYGTMDATPEPALDSLVRLAARMCGAPIGLTTLVDDARQLFKSRAGFEG